MNLALHSLQRGSPRPSAGYLIMKDGPPVLVGEIGGDDDVGFCYAVNNTTSNRFSFTNFSSVYSQLCGGTCSGQNETWSGLTTAVGAVFGNPSNKRTHWVNSGADFGVDN